MQKNRPHHSRPIRWMTACLLCLGLLPLWAQAMPGLWQAQKDGQRLWLLGSIHVGTADLYPLDAAIMQAWQQADELILETDLRQLDGATQQELLQLGRLPAGQRLADKLPAPLYRQTVAAAQRQHLPAEALLPLQPWFAALTLTQVAMQQAGYQAQYGVDEYFVHQAETSHKPIVGLEQPIAQFRYLAGLKDHEVEFLQNTLEQLPSLSELLPELIQAWQAGNTQSLVALLNEEQGPPALRDYLEAQLLARRNQAWLPQLMDGQRHPNAFVVVGALHLHGPKGLLALLEQAGYAVTPLAAEATP
ncbi:TraB/GumN family protein [Pseudaeromonas sp. ZJS20]|uniref:TraB/GumN family protein n=1 Tax=Pseudaeromonas aegiceratis TaxID=3153928 RepID=UPI00390C9B0F